MAVLKLTEASIKGLAIPAEKQVLVFDTGLTGFGIRLSPGGKKSFIVEHRLAGKTKRITIGPTPPLSVDIARKRAQVLLAELVQGIDSTAVKKDQEIRRTTLGEALTEYKLIKSASLKARTLEDYDSLLERHAPDWLKRPWVSITPQEVIARHTRIRKEVGGPSANHVLRAAGTVIRFAMKRYRDQSGAMLVSECPVSILTDTGAWHPHEVRERYIQQKDLASWWSAVSTLPDTGVRDLLYFMVLTGFRWGEASTLRWCQVDFQNRTVTLPDTKNKKKHVIPMSKHLGALLLTRKESVSGEHVFPGSGRNGHVVDIRKQIRRVIAESKVDFSPHDLRRTFSNYLVAADVTYYAHKKLMNHSMAGDVTGTHYVSLEVERLREPMERVTDYILRHAGLKQLSSLVPFGAIAEIAA